MLHNIFAFFKRLTTVVGLIVRLVRHRDLKPEVRFRMFFESAGGAFLKLGQILSLRHDLVPPAYAEELLHLLSHVKELSFEEMEKVFVQELGQNPKQFFAKFEEKAIASASISQVYRATLKTGEEVAVKIQRPSVAETFELDFILATFLGWLIGVFHLFDSLQIKDVVSEFVSWTKKELDFRQELHNAQALYAHSAAHPRTIIPRYFAEYSTKRVLVSEFLIDIFPLDNLLVELENHKDLAGTLKQNHQIDVEELAYYFVFDLMRQYYIDGFFHADPHPANVFFAPNNLLGYFDFGIIGQVGESRLNLARIIYGLSNQDLNFASKYFLAFTKRAVEQEIELVKKKEQETFLRYAKVIDKLEEIMIDNLRTDLEKILKPWYEAIEGGTFHHGHSSAVFSKLILKMRDYSIYLPSEVVIFFRTLVIAEMVALRLAPNFDIMRALNRFFATYSLGEIEREVIARTHQVPLGEKIDSTSHLSFEELRELKWREKEQLSFAKERLVNLICHYAEQYEEIRELLKS